MPSRVVFLLKLFVLAAALCAAPLGLAADIALRANPGLITLSACGQPLWRVLDRLQRESGVKFGVEAHIRNEPVCANLQGEDWRQLLEQLLQGYNKVVVHKDDGAIARVLILNHGDAVPQVAAADPKPAMEKAPEAVPQPDPPAPGAKASAPSPPVSWPGAPPVVSVPIDPAEEGSEESAEPSVFLRGQVAPPDLAELESPPDEGPAQLDEISTLSAGQQSTTSPADRPPEAASPPDPSVSLVLPE